VKLELNLEEETVMRYILVILSLCLLVISAQAGTFKDNFNDGNLDGWQKMEGIVGGSEWKVEDGVLKSSCQDTWSELLIGEPEWRNYTFEYDAKMLQTSNALYAMCALLRDNWKGSVESCILSGLSSWTGKNAWMQVWINNDVNIKAANKGFDFQLNQWYHFKHVANEDNFEFYVDGNRLLSLTDPTLPTGRLGLDIFYGCVVYFDNVVITGDDIPDSLNAVTSQGKLATSWGQMKSR
jgi:hypothetical protein